MAVSGIEESLALTSALLITVLKKTLLFFSVPIVQRTMGKHAKHIIFYSETADPEIPTEDIGLPNTERGQ